MQRGLVVIDRSERGKALLREAAATARGDETDLVALSLVTPESFESDVETLEAIGEVEHTHYGEETVLEAEQDDVREFVDDTLDDGSLVGECHVSVAPEDEHVETVEDVAERFDCDHLFITGRKRSPTGKAVFGDVTQRLLLQFPGHVTVSLD